MATKGFHNFVTPRFSAVTSYASPHFNVAGDPANLDGTWTSNQPNIKPFVIKDNFVMNYGTIPPRHLEFTSANKVGFNVGYTPIPTGDIIGGDTVAWNTGEIWTKTTSMASAPSTGTSKYLIYGGIGLAIVAGLFLFFKHKSA